MNALIKEIKDMKAENIKLNGDLSQVMAKVDILDSKTIVEDYFFANSEAIYVPTVHE